MGFFGNIANKALNQAKTVKSNVGYNMSYMKERKIHVKGPAGYTNRGTYKPTERALMYAIQNYKRDGYSVITMPAVNGYKEKVLVLYVKKAAPVRKVTGKAVRSTKAKAKKFTKAINVSGKRYTLASTFGPYQDRARAYAAELKHNYGYQTRLKTLTVNGSTSYAVYTRNPPREKR